MVGGVNGLFGFLSLVERRGPAFVVVVVVVVAAPPPLPVVSSSAAVSLDVLVPEIRSRLCVSVPAASATASDGGSALLLANPRACWSWCCLTVQTLLRLRLLARLAVLCSAPSIGNPHME